MAEALFRTMIVSDNAIKVASAGVAAYEGVPASSHGIKLMAEQGADLSDFKSQRVTDQLIKEADFVFGMTSAHCQQLTTLYPGAAKKIFLLTEWSTQEDIEDPIGGTIESYQRCSDKIKKALEKILQLIN